MSAPKPIELTLDPQQTAYLKKWLNKPQGDYYTYTCFHDARYIVIVFKSPLPEQPRLKS